ncbi:hypothetical protein [Dokdonella sp.]|uniref:hypothetical protein n=1 Tax=Dokdonella sp. TaxID=2291710 RepID=UPI003C53E89C
MMAGIRKLFQEKPASFKLAFAAWGVGVIVAVPAIWLLNNFKNAFVEKTIGIVLGSIIAIGTIAMFFYFLWQMFGEEEVNQENSGNDKADKEVRHTEEG